MGATHQWIPRMEKEAKKFFDNLPSESKQAVFNAVRPLVEADNPLRCNGVCKVQNTHDVWRVHADTHNLRLRVFFKVVRGELILNGFEYEGEVRILGIAKKTETTYK